MNALRASSRAKSYCDLTEALCEQVDEFGLVSFVPLNIEVHALPHVSECDVKLDGECLHLRCDMSATPK